MVLQTLSCASQIPSSEGLVPVAASAVGRKPSTVSPFRDSISSRELPCPRSCSFPGWPTSNDERKERPGHLSPTWDRFKGPF